VAEQLESAPATRCSFIDRSSTGDQRGAASRVPRRVTAAAALARRRLDELEAPEQDPVAIVGMSCRIRRVESPDDLWDLVSAGVDTIALPLDRGGSGAAVRPTPAIRTSYARGRVPGRGGAFDAGFFGSAPARRWRWTPSSACCWKRRGKPWSTRASTALAEEEPDRVFAGLCTDYGRACARCRRSWRLPRQRQRRQRRDRRVAYTLGLEGPAVTVDTACSSSLVRCTWPARRCARVSAPWPWHGGSP